MAFAQSETVNDDSSLAHREGKRYELGYLSPGKIQLQPFGFYGAYKLERDSELTLHISKGRWDTIPGITTSGLYRSTCVSPNYKKFTGNSFYWKSGIEYCDIDYELKDTNPFNSEFIKFKAKAASLSFSIGNQWQWEHFTVGIEWIGLYVPFWTSISDEYTSPSNDYERDKMKQYQNDFKRIALDGGLYFGWSF